MYLDQQRERFEAQVKAATEYYNQKHESEAWQQVQQEEIAEEKERKKDMQRKRRREKTLQNEHAKRDEAIALAQQAADDDEKERLLREAQKHDRKARATNQLLQGNTPSKDIRELTPLVPNLEGGAMSSFQLGDDTPSSVGKRGGRKGGNRPRKSKEQKQAGPRPGGPC
jgi:chromatin-remodeling ATPase INO80